MNRRKTLLISSLAALALLLGFFYRSDIKSAWQSFNQEPLPEAVPFNADETSTPPLINEQNDNDNNEPPEAVETPETIPPEEKPENQPQEEEPQTLSYNLSVPFTSQAPFADWSMPFKEACEEASVLMVDYYYRGKTFTKEIATQEIVAMVDWQNEYFGGHYDLTTAQTKEMIEKYYDNYTARIINNPSVDDIKKEILNKHPVILPAAGRELGNPNFRSPGPIYHMLVIKGFNETQFITNDPGTRNGADYLYDYRVIMDAMHNWNEANIQDGAKQIIVIDKK